VGLSRLGSSDDHQTPGNSQTSGNSQWGDNPNSARRLVGLFDRSVSVRHNSQVFPHIPGRPQRLSTVIGGFARGDTTRQSLGHSPDDWENPAESPLNPTENPAESLLNPTENPAESPLNPTHPLAITI